MKKLIAAFATVLMALLPLIAAPASAIVVKEDCLSSTHQIVSYNFTLNGVGYNYTETLPCLNGCSSSFGKCRWDPVQTSVYAGVLSVGLILLTMYATNYGGAFEPILLLLLITFGALIYTTDAFIGYESIILLIVTLAMMAVTAVSMARGHRQHQRDNN